MQISANKGMCVLIVKPRVTIKCVCVSSQTDGQTD